MALVKYCAFVSEAISAANPEGLARAPRSLLLLTRSIGRQSGCRGSKARRGLVQSWRPRCPKVPPQASSDLSASEPLSGPLVSGRPLWEQHPASHSPPRRCPSSSQSPTWPGPPKSQPPTASPKSHPLQKPHPEAVASKGPRSYFWKSSGATSSCSPGSSALGWAWPETATLR